jgi:hypothetical protein
MAPSAMSTIPERSIVLLPPGHSAGALTKDAVMGLLEEVATARSKTARYRDCDRRTAALLDVLDQR